MDGFVLMAIKRIAVETAFFCESPYDSDNGFERLMVCKTRSDLNSSAFGDVFLHPFLRGKSVEEIKCVVLNSAIQLIVAIKCQYRSNCDPPCQSKTDPPLIVVTQKLRLAPVS
ncbi:hypothetical protein M6G53_15260 [Serratia nevei]|uniref:hypothetical protein n=1 Tax=Serratia nevei TaxID=2703794 RepID=UPI00209D6C00|nr:hypothetical protein [Serratia nevei]MCP1106741.1 hypothetical protein [Serratia nevei]